MKEWQKHVRMSLSKFFNKQGTQIMKMIIVWFYNCKVEQKTLAGRKGGWMGGWMDVKAGLRIAYSNQKYRNV